MKKDKSPLTDAEHIIASIIEGFFILLIVMIVLFGLQYVFGLSI